MEAKYIAMIVIGGIFVFLLLIYLGYQIERTNENIHNQRARQIYYSSKNLTKMEYDIAFPSNVNTTPQSGEEQVTMDEVINESDNSAEFEMPVFNISEFEGSKVIIGKYNPNNSD
ncbi:MAG: hypothetical protein ACI4MQ_05075 [Candidatus Coproplasma sp.]